MNGATNCPECGARMAIKSTNHGGGITFRVAECDCGERWELEERRVHRLPARVQPPPPVYSRTQPSTAASGQGPPPTAASPPVQPCGGVGGALPSDPIRNPDSGPISPADPERARARDNPLTSAELCRVFGMIRCEALKVGLPWQGVRADHAKAANMAEGINADPSALRDLPETIRLFFRTAQAGRYDRAADMLRDPAFAFGAWCSRFTALREELHGKQPAAPLTPEERQRAEARARTEKLTATAIAATDRQIAKLREAQGRAAPRPKSIGIVVDGRAVDVAAEVAALAEQKAATGG